VGFFILGLPSARLMRQWLASDLLFDNLVSDLQFFCQPRLYMAEACEVRQPDLFLSRKSVGLLHGVRLLIEAIRLFQTAH
jgi:hypothetical protein